MIVKKATEEDIPLIADMALRIWNGHYVPIVGQEQVDYMLNKFYSAPALTIQMDEGQAFYIAYENEKPLGYLSISEKEDGHFLHKFYLELDLQGKGIGSRFFEEVMKLYNDVKAIRLTVNRKNYKSINFYFKLGFYIESVADFDIGNGYFMNDFVMVRKDF